MDVLEELLTSSSHGSVSPETLEYMGQKASEEFINRKVPLSEAIVKLASLEPNLNNEHIHRIVEFANNATFQKLFERGKDKNVHFPVAVPGDVIRDLRDGGSPSHSGRMLSNKADYGRPPIREKDSEVPNDAVTNMLDTGDVSGQYGQGEPIQKVASAAGLDPSYEGSANPVNDIYAEHLKLQRAKDELSAGYETADLLHKQAQADFYRLVKGEVLAHDGAGINGIASAMQKIAGVKVAEQELMPLVERLMRDGVSSDLLTGQLRKTAGRILNSSHPLAETMGALIKCAHERDVAHEALLDVEKALEKTSSFLRQAAK